MPSSRRSRCRRPRIAARDRRGNWGQPDLADRPPAMTRTRSTWSAGARRHARSARRTTASTCTATVATRCTDPPRPRGTPSPVRRVRRGDGRPTSRPATVSVTLLPPVSQLKAEVGPATVALSWSAHPDARVEVTRTAPGAAPAPVRVDWRRLPGQRADRGPAAVLRGHRGLHRPRRGRAAVGTRGHQRHPAGAGPAHLHAAGPHRRHGRRDPRPGHLAPGRQLRRQDRPV